MLTPYTHLGDMPITTFLADYWQKKPLLIRHACNNELPMIPAPELAGLSLEAEVESRLIENEGQINNWRVLHDPLQTEDFAKTRPYPWTLLVQGVDRYLPEAYRFLSQFRFVPAWRLDDLMVSYATEGAGVGAHYDRYDVFLIQGEGRRRWDLGQMCSVDSTCLTHTDLHLLADFDKHTSYELNLGDLLYIPPLMAHQGVALTDQCVTLSVGFRAPAYGEIWQDFAHYISDQLSLDQRLRNKQQTPQVAPAQIAQADIEHIQAILQQQLTQENIGQWFGHYCTFSAMPTITAPDVIDQKLGNHIDQPVDEGIDESADKAMDVDELMDILAEDYGLCRVAEDARLLYFQVSPHSLSLFVNGESIPCDANAGALASLLADELVVPTSKLANYLIHPTVKPTAITLFLQLYNQASVYFDDE